MFQRRIGEETKHQEHTINVCETEQTPTQTSYTHSIFNVAVKIIREIV